MPQNTPQQASTAIKELAYEARCALPKPSAFNRPRAPFVQIHGEQEPRWLLFLDQPKAVSERIQSHDTIPSEASRLDLHAPTLGILERQDIFRELPVVYKPPSSTGAECSLLEEATCFFNTGVSNARCLPRTWSQVPPSFSSTYHESSSNVIATCSNLCSATGRWDSVDHAVEVQGQVAATTVF
jgi:hypothetical protein